MPYLGGRHRVHFPTGKVEKDDTEQVLLGDQILLLLYLATAKDYLETEAIVGVAADCVHQLKKIRDGF